MKNNVLSIIATILSVISLFVNFLIPGPQGPQGIPGEVGIQGAPGIVGPQGPAGKDADPMALLQDPEFLIAVKQALESPSTANPYMQAYQQSLEYTVPAELRAWTDLPAGFEPVSSLVMTDFVMPSGYKVSVPDAPADVSPWTCFPQDYTMATDDFNRGCKELQLAGKLPWGVPVAGYNDGNNWSSDSPNGWSASDIQALNWRAITAYEVCHPAIGCAKDPDGGAVLFLMINFHDSDEVWNVRNNTAVFMDAGWEGYGLFFDLTGGSYDVGEGIAHIRNFYINQLTQPVGGDNRYKGQCGDSSLCADEGVTYIVVGRIWDRPEIGIGYSHFELLDYGKWKPAE